MSDTDSPSPDSGISVSFQISEANFLSLEQTMIEGNIKDINDFFLEATNLFLHFAEQARNLQRPAIYESISLVGTPVNSAPIACIYEKALERHQKETSTPVPAKASHLTVIK